MKNRGTYLLLALFFASLVGLWVADFAQVPSRFQRERMSNRVLHELLDTKPDDLRKIEILGGDEPIVFERRKGNKWQMTAPKDVAADPSMVEALAYNLKELSRKPDAATLEGDPIKFGLTPPERTIRLWGPSTDAPLASLELGRTSLDRRYVRHAGSEGVEVVDAKGLDLVKFPAVRWRDHELFRVPSFEVDGVTITSGEKVLKLSRGRDAWRVASPIRMLAAEPKVDGLIADLGSLKVLADDRFVADDVRGADLDRYGLKTPAMTIEIDAGRSGRPRDPQVIHVGKPIPGKDGLVYVLPGGQDDVVAVDQRVLKDLKPDPNAFRSPKVADINPPRVVRIAVEKADGDVIEAVRTASDWMLIRPSPARADKKAIQDFLKSLDQLQTSTYLNPQVVPESGLDKPAMILKVWEARDPRDRSAPTSTDPKGELALNLRVGRREVARKSTYAQVEGDPTILALPDSANEFLPRSELAFRDRQILAQPVDQIEQIRIIGSGRDYTIAAPPIKHDNMGITPFGWWMIGPVDSPTDGPAVDKLLKLLSNLRAESLVTEKREALDKYGLKTPALTLTWSTLPPFSLLREPSRSVQSPGTITFEDHSLLIGSPVADRPNLRFAKLADQPLIFTVGADVLSVLDLEWRDHRVLTFEPNHVRKVQLDWPDRGFAANPVEESGRRKWSLEGAVDAPDFDPAQIDVLVQAASKLTTTRYVQHLGEFREDSGLNPPRLAIRLDLDDGSAPRTLKIGASTGRGQVLATTDTAAKGSIFLLPENVFGAWTKAPRRTGDLPENVFAP